MKYEYWVMMAKSVDDGTDIGFLNAMNVAGAFTEDATHLVSALRILGADRQQCFDAVEALMAQFMTDIGYEDLAIEVMESNALLDL